MGIDKCLMSFIHHYNVIAQRIKHLPAMQGTRVRSLDWEDPLEKEMAAHSGSLAWEIPSPQLSPVTQSCPTLCSPMDFSSPGLPDHHQLPEFTQTHVHRVGDAVQPPHPLSSPSPPAFDLSQHQGLFKGATSSHQVAKVLEFQFQHQSFQ